MLRCSPSNQPQLQPFPVSSAAKLEEEKRERILKKKKRGRIMLVKTYVFSVVGRFVNLLVPPHTM